MATVVVNTLYEGGNKIALHITATAADSTLATLLIDRSAMVGPGGVAGDGYPVLDEASWSINRGYENIKLYYEDEGNDLAILLMSGDGSYNATGLGGGSVDTELGDEDSTIIEADYDVSFDVIEHADEVAGAVADITLVFRKRSFTGVL